MAGAEFSSGDFQEIRKEDYEDELNWVDVCPYDSLETRLRDFPLEAGQRYRFNYLCPTHEPKFKKVETVSSRVPASPIVLVVVELAPNEGETKTYTLKMKNTD